MMDTIHIVDDEESIRDSLSFLFASRGLETRAWASGEVFLDAQPLQNCACLILDVRMGGLSGPEVFDRLKDLGWSAPVVFLTGHADVPIAVQALKAGAFDFIEKPFNDNQLVDIVVQAVARFGERQTRAGQRQEFQRRVSLLSTREIEVMRLMLQGRLNKQIAHELGIAMRTVEVHRSRILAKAGVRNATELAAMLAEIDVDH